jgi:acyl-ACP thioesterase
MRETTWTAKYEINSLLVNTQRRLGLYSLLNLLQDIAWQHATHLGHGYESVLEKKMSWVLTRQKVVMSSWPKWGEEVEIVTWLRPMQPPFVVREFEVFQNGVAIGAATTSWLMIDMETRRPLKRGVTELEDYFRTDYRLPFDAPKISLQEEGKDLVTFQVRNSDLDLNEHVNNTKYAQWILDSIPMEWHRIYALHEYEVNFIAETRSNDLITIRQSTDKLETQEPFWAEFYGWRQSDQKVVFATRMLISRLGLPQRDSP